MSGAALNGVGQLGDPSAGASGPSSAWKIGDLQSKGASTVGLWLGNTDTDQSGNGNNAVQTTSANQPTIVSSGSVVLEAGKPTLQFDGIDDKLQADSVSLVQPFQFFFVAKVTTDDTVSNSIIDATGQRANFFLSASIGTTINAGAPLSDGAYPSNVRTLYTGLYNSANSLIARQGTITATGDAGSGGLTQMTIGNNSGGNQLNYLTGPMQELIIYPSNQSANRIAIESNINAHYSIYP